MSDKSEKGKKRGGKGGGGGGGGGEKRGRRARKHRPPGERRMQAARMAAEGRPFDEIAAELGYADESGARKAAEAVLRFDHFDDVKNCRLVANKRLDAVRGKLLQLAGIVDHENPQAKRCPEKPAAVASGERVFTKDEAEAYRLECMEAGFFIDGSPLTIAEPAQQVGACRAMIALEQRRARMFGYDAPKHVINSEGKGIDDMTDEELVRQCEKHGVPIPPAVLDAVRKTKGLPPLASEDGGAPALAPQPAPK